MSKRDLHKDIRRHGGYILSDGTLNLRHLLAKAHDLLEYYGIQSADLKRDIRSCYEPTHRSNKVEKSGLWSQQYYDEIEIGTGTEELAGCIWAEDIYDKFNELAPNGYYFGASEGDGACIGWFKDCDYEEVG